MARIIIADDDPLIVELVRSILEPEGHIVGALEDGTTVREVVERKQPDLLILDCMMPGKSGIDVLREIRGSDVCRRVPVLMLTARGSRTDQEIAYYSGADDYISKPFDREKLALRVNALLEHGSSVAPMPTSNYGVEDDDEPDSKRSRIARL
ncbi:response regulator transcription factor [Alteriqipengyuania sp. 357]